jgi:hypothetical protein
MPDSNNGRLPPLALLRRLPLRYPEVMQQKLPTCPPCRHLFVRLSVCRRPRPLPIVLGTKCRLDHASLCPQPVLSSLLRPHIPILRHLPRPPFNRPRNRGSQLSGGTYLRRRVSRGSPLPQPVRVTAFTSHPRKLRPQCLKWRGHLLSHRHLLDSISRLPLFADMAPNGYRHPLLQPLEWWR